MKIFHLLSAVYAVTLYIGIVTTANAVTIGFDPVTPPGGVYAGHMEDGFTITPLVGAWRKQTGTFYNSNKYIETISSDFQSVQVTNGLFTFSSFDAAHLGGVAGNSPIAYFADGFRNGIHVFNVNGYISKIPGTWLQTIINPNANIVIDELIIGQLSGQERLALDNIVVSAIPIPPAAWLFGSGLLGIIGIAKRKNAV